MDAVERKNGMAHELGAETTEGEEASRGREEARQRRGA
jgi:hypothetical protein